MSHFTVAVITADKNKIEEMLAPYSENLEVAPYIDETKEELINKAKERKERYLKEKAEGKKIDDWQEEYTNAKNDEELYKCETCDYDTYDEQRKLIKYTQS